MPILIVDVICAAMPSAKPPSMAPGTFPMPPRTAAVNALIPAMNPMMQMANPQYYGNAATGMMNPMTGMMMAPMALIP